MISISHLSIHFGGHFLFDDISFNISIKDRIGLTGKNGAGKSTMLKIIAGVQSPEEGDVSKPNGFTIGYLSQDIIGSRGKTVFDEIASGAFKDVMALHDKIDDLSAQLSSRDDYESDEYSKLIHDISDANDEFFRRGGTTMRADIQSVLNGLGFEDGDLDRMTDEFSGGWQMRMELAKILLRRPNCILLDEPTNHLDIESIQWLEQFLKNYDGAVVLVSHDRTFLDTVTNRTIEIVNGRAEDYPMSYSKYVIAREERRATLQSAYDNQQRQIAQTERFIERFKSKANLASRVQSRMKQLDKLDRIELEDEDTAAIKFRFPPAPRSGKVVVESHDLRKSFGDNHVIKGIEFAIDRGDRIAFVGKNGEGKTTTAKILAGKLDYQGKIEFGHNILIGYFEQHQAESLESGATVFETIDDVAKGEMRTRIRSLLGAFLFSGDAVNKKVSVLSGGEKGRLALAKLLLEPFNFLILDEPTNHLDMRSKDVLKQALMEFDGTLVVVSHDRDFLRGLTNKVLEFKGGNIKEYIGDVDEYLRAKNIENLSELERKNKAKNQPEKAASTPVETPKESTKDSSKQSNDSNTKRIKKRIEEVEKKIGECEERIATLDTQMSDADFYKHPSYAQTVDEHASLKKSLDSFMEEWSSLNEQLS